MAWLKPVSPQLVLGNKNHWQLYVLCHSTKVYVVDVCHVLYNSKILFVLLYYCTSVPLYNIT